MTEQQLISPSGIAKLTGLKMPTISNWRKRDETFPKPVAGTEARPLFSLAEVTAWIKSTGKKVEFKKRGYAWELSSMLRDRYSVHEYHQVLLLLIVLTHWAREEQPEYLRQPSEHLLADLAEGCSRSLSENELQRHRLVGDAVYEWSRQYGGARNDDRLLTDVLHRIAQIDDLAGLTAELLDLMRGSARHTGIGEHLATRELSDLLISLLPPGGSDYMDFASGAGQTLLTAANTSNGWKIHGIEINPDATYVAASLMYLHGVEAELERANLLERSYREQFDRITCHGPFGMRLSDRDLDWTVWPFGKPPRSASDIAWPQMAYKALREGGHAAVVVAPGILFKGGANADIIKRMVNQNVIEAVISLPPNTQLNTAIPVSILLLQKGDARGEVLMVDVSDKGPKGSKKNSGQGADLNSVFEQALSAVEAWREGGDGSSKVSIAVPLADLMAPDAVLAPQRWLASLAELTESDVDSLVSDVDAAKEAWVSSVVERPEGPANASVKKTAESFPLRTLPELGLEIIRGDYIRPKTENETSDPTTQVFTLKSVRTGEPEQLPAETERARKNPIRSSVGDVLVASLGNRIHARVCREEGLDVDRNVSIVRSPGQAWDPDFIAQQLMSEHNQAMLTGVTVMRVDVKQLLLPPLPIQVQHEVGRMFRDLSEFATAARQAAENAEAYVHALRDATASGTLTVGAV